MAVSSALMLLATGGTGSACARTTSVSNARTHAKMCKTCLIAILPCNRSHGGCCAPGELVVMRRPDGVPRSPRPPDHTGYRQAREYEGDQCRSELARPSMRITA